MRKDPITVPVKTMVRYINKLIRDLYKPMPYVSMGHPVQKWPDFKVFHWELFLDDVEADQDYVKNLN